MARNNDDGGEAVISIVGPQMRVVGDLETEGTVRIEGHVEGNIQAGKAVVVGKDGEVHGDIRTEDSVVSGRVRGSVTAASRLEVQASARIDGEIHARRLQLEEGAMLNGTVRMGEVERESPQELHGGGFHGGPTPVEDAPPPSDEEVGS